MSEARMWQGLWESLCSFPPLAPLPGAQCLHVALQLGASLGGTRRSLVESAPPRPQTQMSLQSVPQNMLERAQAPSHGLWL